MVGYADTSFLVSLYGQDANSPVARRIAAGLSEPFAFTALLRHETLNAFRLAVFRGEITVAECRAAITTIEVDVSAGVLAEVPVVWTEIYAAAEKLSAVHTPVLGTRASDVLHVATATALGMESFYSFDTRQRSLAMSAGLRVLPRRLG